MNDKPQDDPAQPMVLGMDGAMQKVGDKVDQATNDVSQFAEKGTQVIQDKLDSATNKVESVFSVLDNFLKKF
jgi:hypothetical protein